MKSREKNLNNTVIAEIVENLEDEFTEEEIKQLEEDYNLDGGPGNIPTWSNCYKPKKDTDK